MTEIYDSMIQPRGAAYRESQVKSHSHYLSPIDNAPGRLAGNSHIWGDARPEVQSRAIDVLIDASERSGLNVRQTAHVLAIARVESGFNPDAAAGTTSAYGLGQFIRDTGAQYGLDATNQGSAEKQAEALVAHYLDNANLAQRREQGEEYIYKYHHDGPASDYGGLQISNTQVTPYIERYEQFVRQHQQQRNFNPMRDIEQFSQRLQKGTLTFGIPITDGMPDYLRAKRAAYASGHAVTNDALSDDVLRQGEQGPSVVALQENLNLIGAHDKNGHSLKTDGAYGRSTHEAVENFQLWSGMPTTGIADRATLDAVKIQAGFAAMRRGMGRPVGTHLADNLVATDPLNRTDAADLNKHEANHSHATSAPTAASSAPKVQPQQPSQTQAPQPIAPAPIPEHLRDFRHPEHPMHHRYEKALEQVHAMETGRGMAHGPNSERLAAALTDQIAAARYDGDLFPGFQKLGQVEVRGREVVAIELRENYYLPVREVSVNPDQAISRTVEQTSQAWSQRQMSHLHAPAQAVVQAQTATLDLERLSQFDLRHPEHARHREYQDMRGQLTRVYAHNGIALNGEPLEQATAAALLHKQEGRVQWPTDLELRSDPMVGAVGAKSTLAMVEHGPHDLVMVTQVTAEQMQQAPEASYQQLAQVTQQQAIEQALAHQRRQQQAQQQGQGLGMG